MTSQVLVPMSGVNVDKFMAKQTYTNDSISQNMFSAPNTSKFKVMIPVTTLKGVTIQKLWDSIFSDGSDFLTRYHDKRNERDLNVGTWEYAGDKGSGYRVVSLTTIVEVPRAGTPTPLNEAHRFVFINTEDGKLLLSYHISSQTPSVPAGGSFRTEALCEITADSADADCSIGFWGNCRKMSIAFSAIQYIATPRALREMTAAYKVMLEMIAEDLCGSAAIAVVPATDSADDSAAASGGGDGGGGGGDGGGPGLAFQGALLVMAFLVTLLLISTMRSIGKASRETTTLVMSMGGGAALGKARSPTAATASSPPTQISSLSSRLFGSEIEKNATACSIVTQARMTEEEALLNAAREASIQTLRYRWLEVRGSVIALEGTVSTLWWMNMMQLVVVAAIIVKLFFF